LKITLRMMLGAVALTCFLAAAPSLAADTHTILTPSEIKWGPAPPFMRPEVQAAVLFGDPSKKGLFVIRLKFPKGYRLPPHFHPVDEIVEIISGTSQFGMGEKADPNKTQTLPAGSFFFMPPGMPHYAFFDEETVIQINTIGPWAVTYVNPQDDPRKTQ
jgi:quercetin dioxygenase-like cupin family protein